MMMSIASPARSQGLNVKRINSAEMAAAAIATGAHHAACTSTATPATTKSIAASRERLMAAPRTLPNIGERLLSNGTLAGGRGTHTATCKRLCARRKSPPSQRISGLHQIRLLLDVVEHASDMTKSAGTTASQS